MSQRGSRHYRTMRQGGLLVAVLLLAIACAGSETPSPTEFPSSSIVVTPWATYEQLGADPDGAGDAAQRDPDDGYQSLQDYYAPRLGTSLEFEHLTTEDGLSSGTVYWITQDRLGFLWIGTADGLNRYDGRTVKTYRHDPDDPDSLSEDHVFNVLEDRNGTLWVATYGGGLERFDRDLDKFIHYQFDPDVPSSLGNNKVFTIYEDREGALWVGTSGGGLDRYDPEVDGFVHYLHAPDDPDSLAGDYVNVIYEDRAGGLWIGTTTGLDKLDRETGKFTHYRRDPDDPNSLGNDSVFSVIEDYVGYLWIGTSGGGLSRYDPGTEEFKHYRHDPEDPHSLSDDVVFVVLEDRSGTLWVASLGGGVHHFDRENERFIRYQNEPGDSNSLSSDYVNAMFEDREGILWIGTTRALDKYARQRAKFDQALEYQHVQVVFEDQDESVWIGTVDGLYKLNRDLEEVAYYQHGPDDPYSLSKGWVQALYQDSQGVLWVGVSGGGLDRFDEQTGRFSHYRHDPSDPTSLSNDVVNSIYEDQEGVLWVGTDGGLNQFERQRETFRVRPTSPEAPGTARVESIGAILEDSQGQLWISSWGDGLKRLNRGTGEFVAYRHDSNDPHSLRTNFVTEIHEDSVGRLWVGTDGGLHLYDQLEDRFSYYEEPRSIEGEHIQSILEDEEGNLWLALRAGLAQFDPDGGGLTGYDGRDGLQANGYLGGAFRRMNGQMLFGGQDGADVFYPDQVRPNPAVPPVALVSLRQDGEAVELEQAMESVRELKFSWPRNDFEFEFASLSYAQPDKNQHAYILEGYDQDWNYLGTERTGRYVNLPGGTYILRMMGSNDNGVWNEQGLAVTIAVAPPIWETWWFVGTMALLVVGGVFVGYRWRVRSIETRSRTLEVQVTERTAELYRINELLSQEIVERQRAEEALARRAADAAVVEERSRLARDLHDAVTQTLFSASLIAEALPEVWKSDPGEGEQLVQELGQLNRGAMAEMRTLLMELRPAALVEANLGDLLRQLGAAVAGRTGVPVAVTVESCHEPVDQVHSLPAEVHVALYRIAQEALNNVVKHSLASTVEVNIYCTPTAGAEPNRDVVVLFISDDGRGFALDDVPPDRLGLGIIRERAESIGARLKIESVPGDGTQILVVWTGDRDVETE